MCVLAWAYVEECVSIKAHVCVSIILPGWPCTRQESQETICYSNSYYSSGLQEGGVVRVGRRG